MESTNFKTVNIVNLWKVIWPMMLSALSVNFMLLLDRIILGRYDTHSMNAAALVGTLCANFQYFLIAIVSIAEVIVGQYNGSKRYDKLGIPVWQMIWFSLFLSVFFVPMGLFGGQCLIQENYYAEGNKYFKWLMCCGHIWPMAIAISSFFIGTGAAKIVTISAVASNILNAFLDVLLVFGYDPYVPSLGIEGAAIATVISESFQALLLFSFFFRKKNRQNYGAAKFHLNWPVFWNCLRIGVPSAFSHLLEISAWTYLFTLAAAKSSDHVTVMSVCQSLLIACAFIIDGMHKGVTAFASNLIASNASSQLNRLVITSAGIHLILICLLGIWLVLFPQPIIDIFMHAKEVHSSLSPSIETNLIKALRWLWLFLLADGFVWVICGVLISSGDTIFIMTITSLSVWLLGVLPLFIALNRYNIEPATMWQFLNIYIFVSLAIFTWRYYGGKWRNKFLV